MITNTKGIVYNLRKVGKYWQIYILIIPAVIWYVLFSYYPMAGLQLAFKTYKVKMGIWGSPWNGVENFRIVFRDRAFWRAIWRTIYINFGRLLLVFPAPVVLALMLNEFRMRRYGKVMQVVFTFPHFLSWVIVTTIMINLLSIDGLVNGVISSLGGKKVSFLGNASLFVPMLYATDIWKSIGYSAIIYMAAIAGIDQDQYEAAEIDGATRMQRVFYITLPNILPTISVMFIMTTGRLMSAGFDQVFNMSNAATQRVSEILDMYIYRISFGTSVDFGVSTAVSLFRSVVNMMLLLVANKGSKLLGGNGLFG